MSKSLSSAFLKIAKARKSCYRFEPNLEIPQDTLKDILNATLTAPSGFNLQPSQIIVVRDQQIKKQLAQTTMLGPGNVYRTIDSSAVAVFLSDLEPHKRLPRIIELEKEANMRTKQYMASLPIASTFLMGEGTVATLMKQAATHVMSPIQPMPSIDSVQSWAFKNTSLVAQTFVLSATSHGLATCLMEGYDDRRVREVLRIPDRYGVPMVCCLGYEYKGDDDGDSEMRKKKAPRLKPNEVFFGDTFGGTLDLWNSKEAIDEEKDK